MSRSPIPRFAAETLVLGQYAVASRTGLIAATLAADSPLFAFRWSNTTSFARIKEISVSVAISAAITTAVHTSLAVQRVSDYPAEDTGGTAITETGVSRLHPSFPASRVGDLRIATTGTLTVTAGGTRDASNIAEVVFGTGTAVGTTALAQTILYVATALDDDRAPLTLEANQGFYIVNGFAGPATGSFVVGVSVLWDEVAYKRPDEPPRPGDTWKWK